MQHRVRGTYSGVITLLSLSLWLVGNLAGATSFAAQQRYPDKPISIVVNYGPGGARDIIARGVGRFMSRHLGAPVIVVNEPAAGGAKGLSRLYHANPDGYTIGIASGSDITNQIIEKKDYDFKKFTYIGRASSSSALLFVKADSPLRSIKDFKTFGKPIRLSTFSLTSNLTVASMVMADREKFPLVIIGTYKSAAEALQGLLQGEVEFSGGAPTTSMPFIQSERIRPIITMGQKRLPDFPDVPTIGEEGLPDLATFSTDLWFIGPPGISPERRQILESALLKTLQEPEFLTWAKSAGADINPLRGEEVAKTISTLSVILERYKKDIEKYRK